MKQTTLKFEGVDVSLEISLFEYGFICAPCALKEYFVVYNPNTGNGFHTAIVQPKDVNALITGNSWASDKDIASFLSFVGCFAEEWLDASFVTKLSDVISFWGWENIVGSEWAEGMTEGEVREKYLN